MLSRMVAGRERDRSLISKKTDQEGESEEEEKQKKWRKRNTITRLKLAHTITIEHSLKHMRNLRPPAWAHRSMLQLELCCHRFVICISHNQTTNEVVMQHMHESEIKIDGAQISCRRIRLKTSSPEVRTSSPLQMLQHLTDKNGDDLQSTLSQ